MKRKLWLLNFALIAAVAGGAWRLRTEARELRAREEATLRNKPKVATPAPAPAAAPPAPVTAAAYLPVAQQMLWAKDRNSNVIVDPPKPPDPPKPLPPLPTLHGLMNLGDGPIAMMSDQAGARHHAVHPGEMIGKFKMVAIEGEEMVLGFEDRTVRKKLQELMERSQDPAQTQGGATPSGGSTTTTTIAAPRLRLESPSPGRS